MGDTKERLATLEAVHQNALAAILMLNHAKNLDELVLAVAELNAVAKYARLAGIPSLLTAGNAALDIQMVESALHPMVTAMHQLGEVQVFDLAEKFEIDIEAVKLTSYYLCRLGLAEKQGRGRKATLRLASEEISPGLMQTVWISVQPTSPADLKFLCST